MYVYTHSHEFYRRALGICILITKAEMNENIYMCVSQCEYMAISLCPNSTNFFQLFVVNFLCTSMKSFVTSFALILFFGIFNVI